MEHITKTVTWRAEWSKYAAGCTWVRVETEPFSGHYDFTSEQAALDAARQVADGATVQVRRVTTINEIIHREQGER